MLDNLISLMHSTYGSYFQAMLVLNDSPQHPNFKDFYRIPIYYIYQEQMFQSTTVEELQGWCEELNCIAGLVRQDQSPLSDFITEQNFRDREYAVRYTLIREI